MKSVTMRRLPKPLSLVLTAALLSQGCSTGNSTNPLGTKTSQTEAKIDEAGHATAAAAREKRDEYAREMHKGLHEMNVKLEDLEHRASKAEGEAKKDLEKKLAQGKVKRDQAAKKLEELKEAAPERWEKVKDSVENAFDDLKKMFN